MKKRFLFSPSGQTILELVIALGVVALVLTGLIAAVTSSLRYGQASRFRSQGVKYAQEGIELTRNLRDTSTWDVFMTYSGTGTASWCLDSSGAWSVDGGSGCLMEAGSPFWRTITFTWTDPVMAVTSQVSWGEHVTPTNVTLSTYFSQWK